MCTFARTTVGEFCIACKNKCSNLFRFLSISFTHLQEQVLEESFVLLVKTNVIRDFSISERYPIRKKHSGLSLEW